MLKKYWKYIKRTLKHKYYVFIECCKVGQVWHGLIHDISKFFPSEIVGYANYDFSSVSNTDDQKSKFELSWLHHRRRNKHHWNYWVNEVDGKAMEMPIKYIIQMICDWKAMSREFNGDWTAWYLQNKSKIILHDNTIKYIESVINMEKRLQKGNNN